MTIDPIVAARLTLTSWTEAHERIALLRSLVDHTDRVISQWAIEALTDIARVALVASKDPR